MRWPRAVIVAAGTACIGLGAAADGAEQRRVRLVTPGTADDVSFLAATPDGSRVLFHTLESLVPEDNNNNFDLYLRAGGQTTLVSASTGVAQPATNVVYVGGSRDLSRVLFETEGKYTTDDTDTGRTDVYERAGGVTRLVSAPTGVPEADTDGVNSKAVSDNGGVAYFATNQKLTADDTDAAGYDVYVRAGGTTRLVSRKDGTAPDSAGTLNNMNAPGSSSDGTRAAFDAGSDLDPNDTDGRSDVYLRTGDRTFWISRRQSGGPDASPHDAFFRAINRAGTKVFFQTTQPMTASDLEATGSDAFLRSNGTTTLVTTGPADPQTGDTNLEDISTDGARALFVTTVKMTAADNDSNRLDAYLREDGQTKLVTRATGVPAANTANVDSNPYLSQDGRVALFSTTERLAPNDNDGGQTDVYQWRDGKTALVSAASGVPNPAQPDDLSGAESSMTPDGSRVFFLTSKKLAPADTDSGERDVYMRANGVTTLISRPSGVPQYTGNAGLQPGDNASPNRFMFSSGETLTPGDTDPFVDVYASFVPNVAPVVNAASFDPKRFRTGPGTTIRFKLSEVASVRVAFRHRGESKVLGRRTFSGHKGANLRKFHGKLANGNQLDPGRYSATFVARDPQGLASQPVKRNFRILEPK